MRLILACLLGTLLCAADSTTALLSRGDRLIAAGDLRAALQEADAADQASPADPAIHAAAEQIRGQVAAARDLMQAAAEHYQRALAAARQTPDGPLLARTFDTLADAYFTYGLRDRLLDAANQMLDSGGGTADPNRPLYLFWRAMAYSELHSPEAADRDLAEALPLAEHGRDLRLIGEIHRQMGLGIWRYKRDLAAAEHEYDLALDYARRAGAWDLVQSTLNVSGNPFRNPATRNLPEALRRYQEGLAVARREHLSAAHLLKNIGEVYRMMGDAGRAEAALRESIQVADRRNVAEIRWMARLGLGALLRERDPEAAEQYFQQALDLLEARQSDVLLEDFRAGSLAGAMLFANPYDQYIDFLLAKNRPEQAFYVAERQRARTFLDTLSAARKTVAGQVPASFSQAERAILERIKIAQAALRTETLTETARADLLKAVEQDEAGLTNLRLRLAVEHPALAHARYPRIWTVPELQSGLLAPDEALLNLYLGPERSVAWLITRDRLRTFRLPARPQIEKRVREALQELRNPVATGDQAMTMLSQALSIGEIVKAVPATRLVVVADGVLFDVPFEALSDERGKPLLERFAVSYAPSASSLAFLRSAPRGARIETSLVAVANPVLAGPPSAVTRQADLAHVNLLAPLPHTGEEVRQIASLFGRGARIFEGRQATQSELRSSGLEHVRMLHFATHGLIDEERPERSGLVLTADPPRDDGLLQMREIYGLRLDADLVTLSACETAMGQNMTGEGMIGLTRAFFYAGSRAVVASLWDVEDASTSRLMQRFYANIRKGQPIDVALQQAKLDFLHGGGDTSRPFFWASFIVSGQARNAVDLPPGGWTWPVTLAAGLMILLAGAASLYAGNRRKANGGGS